MDRNDLMHERDIERRLGFLARAYDERNWKNVASVFVADATGDFGPQFQLRNRDEMMAMFLAHLGGCGPSQHLLSNFAIDIVSGGANSRCYVSAHHQGFGKLAHLSYLTAGEYRDRWRQTADGWCIIHRQMVTSIFFGSSEVLGPPRE
jgi:hypothetical protein